MDSLAVSKRSHTKGNKENDRPVYGCKSFIKSGKTSAAPLQPKSNKKEETIAQSGPLKSKSKMADTRSMTSEALRKVKTVQSDGTIAAATRAKHPQMESQAVKDRKTVPQVPKSQAAAPSSKPAPGTYKGKIIQSKIGSIWKSSATVSGTDPKPDSQRVGNVTKMSSKSLPVHGTHKSAQTRPKPPSSRPVQVSKPAVTSCRPARSCSARLPAKTVPGPQTTTNSRNTNVAFNKSNGAQKSKPKIPETDKKAKKPPVSSTLSHYRLTMETAEEKRAKLAEWLASKGKTLKRPAMTAAASVKTTVSAKPKADLKPRPQPAAQRNPENEARPEAHKPGLAAAAHCADTHRAQLTTRRQTPRILNTSPDLLDSSDADLPVDPEDSVEDIVMNLCDALEAMATRSICNDEEPAQATDACDEVEVEESKPNECKKEERKRETPENVGEQLKGEQVTDEVEEEMDDEEERRDDCGTVSTPQMEGASSIKYSVKTTPYLQSVKKTIMEDTSTNSSMRRSRIKDLKFLTPVRRSCRIEGKSSHLPTMLLDHDPCVSSLAELVQLDDDPNAYIYRKNPSLLEDLPDRNKV